jgi:integrase
MDNRSTKIPSSGHRPSTPTDRLGSRLPRAAAPRPGEPSRKRKHNEGGFRQRPSGKWEGSRWVSEVGQRIYATATTEAKARKLLEERVDQVRRGEASARRTDLTFRAFAEQVIDQREGLGDRTRDMYHTTLTLYLADLHAHKLGKITPALLRSTYAALRKRRLSDTVRGHAHTLARLVLETAMHDGLIAKNPADTPGVRPKPERGAEQDTVQAYDREQTKWILEAAAEVTHGELVAFLALTGMRRGEALALRWNAVDLTRKIAEVRATRSVSAGRVYEGSPKTRQSRRHLPLSDDVIVLLGHLAAKTKERREALYPDRSPSAYVFPTLHGTPQRPDNVRRILLQVLDVADRRRLVAEERRARSAGEAPGPVTPLPRLRVHSLRHTFVSLLAASGVRLEVIAGWIGDQPATVMKVYLHVFRQDTEMPSLGLADWSAYDESDSDESDSDEES